MDLQGGEFHFIGIGGVEMSALAHILLKRNAVVTGSDVFTNDFTESLMQKGAKIIFGHAPENIPPQATVVYSSSIKGDNPEYQEAVKKKCSIWHRSDLLLNLMEGYKTLGVAGTTVKQPLLPSWPRF